MADGKAYLQRIRPAILTTQTAVGKYIALAEDTAQSKLKVAGASDKVVAVTAEAVGAVAADRWINVIDLEPGAVVPMVASAAITRLTGTLPTKITPGASGKVNSTGTGPRIGRLDNDSPAAGADLDVIYVFVEPEAALQTGSVLALTARVSDATAGVTSTKFATLTLPTGVSATVLSAEATARTVGAAGATVDVKEAGTTILSGPIAVTTGGVSTPLTLADTDLAAAAVLTFFYTTGASTGSLVDCTVTVIVRVN